jgi:adenylate cyclase
MVPQLTPLLGYLLTVHLRQDLKNALIHSAELETGKLDGGREITVCFADLVGFTKMGERVAPAELGIAGRQLTALAVDAARPPVRLVKMIGDAAMLVSTEPEPLVQAALDLTAAAEVDDAIAAPLRVGVASGQAVTHMGDWLGAPVNLASRVTDVAKPGSVLATKAVHDLTRDAFEWSRAGSRRFKGVRDPVTLYRVRPKLA